MSDDGHDLHAEFPEARDVLHQLKLGNAHFNAVAERYRAANHEIRQIEDGLAPASDARLETLKKARLALLDEVARMIAAQQAA